MQMRILTIETYLFVSIFYGEKQYFYNRNRSLTQFSHNLFEKIHKNLQKCDLIYIKRACFSITNIYQYIHDNNSKNNFF